MPRYAPNSPQNATARPDGSDIVRAAVELGQKLQYEYGMECARRYAAAMRGILPESAAKALYRSLGIAPEQAAVSPPPRPEPSAGSSAAPNPIGNLQTMLLPLLLQLLTGNAMQGGAGGLNPAMLMQLLSRQT